MNRPIIIVSKHINLSCDMANKAALIIRVESGTNINTTIATIYEGRVK